MCDNSGCLEPVSFGKEEFDVRSKHRRDERDVF